MKECTDRGRIRATLKRLNGDELEAIDCDWPQWVRPDQCPPGKPFRTWLVLGGRGAGKTRTGAEWIKWLALNTGPRRIALVAPTFDEARLVMIEGPSGLLRAHTDGQRPVYESSKRQILWDNGSVAQVFSAEKPDGLRGPQFDAAWCDELTKWKYPDQAWDMLQFGLRLGRDPQAIVTTTPRPIPLLRKLLVDESAVTIKSSTWDNGRFLAPPFLKEVWGRYGNTKLGRQELDAELIEDDPEALWNRDKIEALRVREMPELKRVVVAIDPPAGKSKGANACGIVCAGLGVDERCYVLDDWSVHGLRPAQWAKRAVMLYQARQADRIIAEVNQGGAMVEEVLRQVDDTVSYRAVHARDGKRTRAEPVAALYEQGKVSHVGCFPDLEDEMCSALDGGKSPDRVDALVWAVTELKLKKRAEPRIRVL